MAIGSPSDVTLDEVKQRALEVLTDEWVKTSELLAGLDDPKPSDNQLRKALNALCSEMLAMRDPKDDKAGATYKWRRAPHLPRL